MHEIQLQILKKLLFAKELRYTDLKPDVEMENNQLDFHLDKLIAEGYIENGEKHYFLTNLGKEYANRMDTDQVVIAKQSKVTAWICCSRRNGKAKQYLIYTRLKQPFYGCQGFMSGKVRYGEKVVDAARRELLEETGLKGSPQIVSIKHFLVYDKSTKELVEDKFMFLCLVKNPQGSLSPDETEGKYQWVDEDNLRTYITNPFEPIDELLSYLEETQKFTGQMTLHEVDHYSDKF